MLPVQPHMCSAKQFGGLKEWTVTGWDWSTLPSSRATIARVSAVIPSYEAVFTNWCSKVAYTDLDFCHHDLDPHKWQKIDWWKKLSWMDEAQIKSIMLSKRQKESDLFCVNFSCTPLQLHLVTVNIKKIQVNHWSFQSPVSYVLGACVFAQLLEVSSNNNEFFKSPLLSPLN